MTDNKQHYLREWRTARGLSQEQLGERIGRTKSAVSKVERSDRGLGFGLARLIAPALGIDQKDLFTPPPVEAFDEPPRPEHHPHGGDVDLDLLTTAVESALLLTRHANLTHREIAEQAVGAYAKALRRRMQGGDRKPD